jgi:IMP dehydrogenase
MKLYNNQEALCFDDILMVPKPSSVESRKDIDLNMSIGVERKIDLYLPIIASPMDTVCEQEMAMEVSSYGGLGIIHRFMSNEKQTQQVNAVAVKKHLVGAAVGVSTTNNSVLNQVKSLVYSGAKVILVDTANGHNSLAVNTVREIRKAFPEIHIMAGNVSTWDGFMKLAIAGADSVRVGIGGGSMCSTRIVTGHGMPTLASIMEIYEMLERLDLPTSIIADGGIKNSGDAIKAFAAGADAIMLGSALAGHKEAPGKLIERGEKKYKEFRGMASRQAQENWHGKVSVVEGESTLVHYKGDVGRTLDEWRAGIQSGCSYSGVHSLEDLQLFSEYIRVTPNSLKESVPHGKS